MFDENDPREWLHVPAREGRTSAATARIYHEVHQIWRIARKCGGKRLGEGDPSATAARLEDAIEAVQRSGTQPKNWGAYLLQAVSRDISREQKRRKHGYVQPLGPDTIASLRSDVDIERDRILDDLMEKIRARLDAQGLLLLDGYLAGLSWAEIARRGGYANAHSAQGVFKRRIDKICEELGLTNRRG